MAMNAPEKGCSNIALSGPGVPAIEWEFRHAGERFADPEYVIEVLFWRYRAG